MEKLIESDFVFFNIARMQLSNKVNHIFEKVQCQALSLNR